MANDASPRWDRRMQQRLARGEAAALGELYDRFASLVHGLAHRVLDDDDAADRITREVFGYVWEHPDVYDPKQGPMRSWVASITHRQAVQQLRRTEAALMSEGGDGTPDGRQGGPADGTRAGAPDGTRVGAPGVTGSAGPDGPRGTVSDRIEAKVRAASTAARADYIRNSMPASLRAALELAYFKHLDYRQAAADLGVTHEEARRRLRLGLQLLATAHQDTGRTATSPGYGRAT